MKIKRLIHLTYILLLAALCTVMPASAAQPDRYAASSRMAAGRWAKVRIDKAGMQFVSNEQLRAMGFTDPSRVNVYGYGGRLINEVLIPDLHPDDLPLQPVVRTQGGICFYAVDIVGWNATGGSTYYKRTRNHYSEHAWYLLSDADLAPEEAELPMSASAAPGYDFENRINTTFRDRLIHEQDIVHLSNTGRQVFGEDFRSTPKRSFSFDLPGIAGDAFVNTNFVARTENGESQLSFVINGEQKPQIDVIPGVSGTTAYASLSRTHQIPSPGKKLTVEIKYSTSGALKEARLDYIQIEYVRDLSMQGLGYLVFPTNQTSASYRSHALKGATADTQIWDYADPARPVRVPFQLTDGTAYFQDHANGLHEYVAINPAAVQAQANRIETFTRLANQDIHAMPVPDMLIITPPEYLTQAERLARLHTSREGLLVHVLTPQTIYNEFSSGTPDLSAWRKCLKMWYDRGEQDGHRLRYALIMGRGSYDQLGLMESSGVRDYPHMLMWQSDTFTTQEHSYGTDDFIGILDDPTDNYRFESSKVSIAVGRMPVKSVAEASQAVDKIEKYLTKPLYGPWRNSIVLVADDGDTNQHLEQTEDVYNALLASGNDRGRGYIYDRIYMDSYERVMSAVGMTYPDATSRFLRKLNEGVMFVNYIGHASPKEWSHEKFLTWPAICSLSNQQWPWLYAATCEFGRWDADDISGAETMWLNPTAGIIGAITATRSVYIGKNGPLAKATASNFFNTDSGRPLAIGDVYVLGKNQCPAGDDNRFRYILMGDPALRLPVPTHSVELLTINGEPADEADPTVVSALDVVKISGVVRDPQGAIDETFDGVLDLTLLDAEVPIRTHGHDSDPYLYNDRTNTLMRARASVTKGRWDMTIKMPYAISNNFSPAQLNFYAYSNDGVEANSASESIIVYGIADDTDLGSDTAGPEITYFGLNGNDFRDGDHIAPSPMVLARFTDPSGINFSDAAIGQALELQLDDNKPLTDVADYYTPDTDDPDAGSILYPLDNLDPGDHRLTLRVRDNLGNMSVADIHFKVDVNAAPNIFDVYTDASPAKTTVSFFVEHDRSTERAETRIEVFNLAGRRVWTDATSAVTGHNNAARLTWDLSDNGGARVPRGIYLYRATVTTERGASSSKSKKIAVAAP